LSTVASTAFVRARRAVVGSLLLLVTVTPLVTGVAAPAYAGSRSQHTHVASFNTVSAAPAILREAARHAGAPYRYGAAGPRGFDCSGYTMYVFSRFGVRLPHNSGAQRAATRRIPASERRPGDLIFFHTGSGRVTHVAIYAGGNMMWHSPHSGLTVRRAPIYSSRVSYGRAG
jgi:cell wall-associated NlpC family hydrolase